MKFVSSGLIMLTVLTVSPALVGQGSAGSAIAYKSGDPAEWPPELDALTAAPKNHTVLLENDEVRVLEVLVEPGELEALHHHRWPSVLHIMEAGHFIDRDADGEVILDTRDLPDPPTFPLTMWKEPEAPHSVENLDSRKPIRLIRVELKN